MSNHLDTVEHFRRQYGTPLGLEHAFAVTNDTAYVWRAEGWGILEKTSGSNWGGYSVDKLVNVREHEAVDCLGDSEGAGNPQWSNIAWEDRFVALWRPPLPSSPTPPDPEPPTDDLETRVTRLEARVEVLESALRDACTALERI